MTLLLTIARQRDYPYMEFKVSLDETVLWQSMYTGEEIMRCVFTTELKVDIDVNDDAQRKAFIDLVVRAARDVYGPAAMIAKKPPAITIAQTSRNGKEEIPLFASAEPDE